MDGIDDDGLVVLVVVVVVVEVVVVVVLLSTVRIPIVVADVPDVVPITFPLVPSLEEELRWVRA